MAVETIHAVQVFVPTNTRQGRRLMPDPIIRCPTADQARARAERLAATKPGVLAYSMTADAELGEYGWPQVLFSAGEVPDDFRGG